MIMKRKSNRTKEKTVQCKPIELMITVICILTL